MFTRLAQDFFYATAADDYEALEALRELFEPGTEKNKIIDFLIAQEEEESDAAVRLMPEGCRSFRPFIGL